ncbi:unnamed protein product, partial [Pleuronectes platessa]
CFLTSPLVILFWLELPLRCPFGECMQYLFVTQAVWENDNVLSLLCGLGRELLERIRQKPPHTPATNGPTLPEFLCNPPTLSQHMPPGMKTEERRPHANRGATVDGWGVFFKVGWWLELGLPPDNVPARVIPQISVRTHSVGSCLAQLLPRAERVLKVSAGHSAQTHSDTCRSKPLVLERAWSELKGLDRGASTGPQRAALQPSVSPKWRVITPQDHHHLG